MRGLSEIVRSNAEAAKRVEAKRKASLRRLKNRIGRIFIDEITTYDRINAAIDAWDAAERQRGTR